MPGASVRAGAGAVSFLTRVPVGRYVDVDGADVARGAAGFPLVGAGVGALTAGVALLAAQALPAFVAAALGVATAAVVTGAMHLDALADTADALGARGRDEALAIMRDSRIGTFGAVALALDLLLKVGCVATLVDRGHVIAVLVAPPGTTGWLRITIAAARGGPAVSTRRGWARKRPHRTSVGPCRRRCGRARRIDLVARLVADRRLARRYGSGRRRDSRSLVPAVARRGDRRLSWRRDGGLRDGRARRRSRARMRLFLCRHAAAGDSDQVAQLAERLAGLDVAAVYTSPLERAAATAEAVAARHGLAPLMRDELREIDLGEVDGLQFEEYTPELQASLLNAPATVRFPGGESYEQLRRRVVGVLDEIVAQHGDETAVAVSHAGAIRAALATWLSIPPEASFRIDQRFAAVNLVDWIDGVPLVRLVNGPGPER